MTPSLLASGVSMRNAVLNSSSCVGGTYASARPWILACSMSGVRSKLTSYSYELKSKSGKGKREAKRSSMLGKASGGPGILMSNKGGSTEPTGDAAGSGDTMGKGEVTECEAMGAAGEGGDDGPGPGLARDFVNSSPLHRD